MWQDIEVMSRYHLHIIVKIPIEFEFDRRLPADAFWPAENLFDCFQNSVSVTFTVLAIIETHQANKSTETITKGRNTGKLSVILVGDWTCPGADWLYQWDNNVLLSIIIQ